MVYHWWANSDEFGFQDRPIVITMMMMIIFQGNWSLIHLLYRLYEPGQRVSINFPLFELTFIFSMLLLVMGSNYLILFIGWEGVGLCSYLLIGFWYENKEYR